VRVDTLAAIAFVVHKLVILATLNAVLTIGLIVMVARLLERKAAEKKDRAE